MGISRAADNNTRKLYKGNLKIKWHISYIVFLWATHSWDLWDLYISPLFFCFFLDLYISPLFFLKVVLSWSRFERETGRESERQGRRERATGKKRESDRALERDRQTERGRGRAHYIWEERHSFRLTMRMINSTNSSQDSWRYEWEYYYDYLDPIPVDERKLKYNKCEY